MMDFIMFDHPNRPDHSSFYTKLLQQACKLGVTDAFLQTEIRNFLNSPLTSPQDSDNFIANILFVDKPSEGDPNFGDFLPSVIWVSNLKLLTALLGHLNNVGTQFKTGYYDQTTLVLYALHFEKYDTALFLWQWAYKQVNIQHTLTPLNNLYRLEQHPEYYKKLIETIEALKIHLKTNHKVQFLLSTIKHIDDILTRIPAIRTQGINPAPAPAPSATSTLSDGCNVDIALAVGARVPFTTLFPKYTMLPREFFQELTRNKKSVLPTKHIHDESDESDAMFDAKRPQPTI